MCENNISNDYFACETTYKMINHYSIYILINFHMIKNKIEYQDAVVSRLYLYMYINSTGDIF